jgi:protein pelota
MKILHKTIDKKNYGTVTLIAEEAEDMWHAYNLISVGDYLRSSTIRRVVNESSVGLTTTSRVHTTLTISVKSLDFDIQASVLRVKGTNFEENQFVKMGAYHTIDLELQRKFSITKNEWDSVSLERIEEACDPNQNADVAAIVMQEGLAHVCLIMSSMTLVKAKIEMNIPRKRKSQCSNHDKSMDRFFERIVQAILAHVNFDVVKAVICASPGFIKEQFFAFLSAYAVKNMPATKCLIDNKSKFLLVHSASGFKHSLKEIFDDQNLAPKLSDTKALSEVKSLDAFYQMLKLDPNRAFYGYKHVEKASESEAIDCLLISDSLFRSQEILERKKYVNIVDRVKENNGQVRIFSSLHVSGEQLLQLTGIAAILRFPMPELEEDLPLSDSDDEDDTQASKGESKSNGHIFTNSDSNPNIEAASVVNDTATAASTSTATGAAAVSKKPAAKTAATTKKTKRLNNYEDDEAEYFDNRSNNNNNYQDEDDYL